MTVLVRFGECVCRRDRRVLLGDRVNGRDGSSLALFRLDRGGLLNWHRSGLLVLDGSGLLVLGDRSRLLVLGDRSGLLLDRGRGILRGRLLVLLDRSRLLLVLLDRSRLLLVLNRSLLVLDRRLLLLVLRGVLVGGLLLVLMTVVVDRTGVLRVLNHLLRRNAVVELLSCAMSTERRLDQGSGAVQGVTKPGEEVS